jgi:hypothetical protein
VLRQAIEGVERLLPAAPLQAPASKEGGGKNAFTDGSLTNRLHGCMMSGKMDDHR